MLDFTNEPLLINSKALRQKVFYQLLPKKIMALCKQRIYGISLLVKHIGGDVLCLNNDEVIFRVSKDNINDKVKECNNMLKEYADECHIDGIRLIKMHNIVRKQPSVFVKEMCNDSKIIKNADNELYSTKKIEIKY